MKLQGKYISLRKGGIWKRDYQGDEKLMSIEIKYYDSICDFAIESGIGSALLCTQNPIESKFILCDMIDKMDGSIYLDAYEKDLTNDKQAAKDYIMKFNNDIFEEELEVSKFTLKKFFKSLFSSSIR